MTHSVVASILAFLKKHWPPILVVGFVLVLHRDMLLWAVPATGDHMIHLFRGWLMAEQMIPSGRLTGWTHMAFAGDAFGVYYPILGDLLVAGFHFLTGGLLPWERTYTLMFLILLCTQPLAIYAVARRATGPAGALVAAVLSIGDIGGWPQGGHYSTVHWAVWPFMLGLSLSMFSVVASERVLTHGIKEHPRQFLGFAVLIGLTALAHPMSQFFLGLAMPLFVIMLIIARCTTVLPHLVLSRAVLAALIGVLLCGFWMVPWITSGSEWTMGWPHVGFGGEWKSLSEMLEGVVYNELFKNFSYISWALGLVGLLLALGSRRLWPTYLGVLLVVVFVFTGACNALGDGIIFRKVQIERMAALMKFAWFGLAGYAVDRLGALLLFGMGKLKDGSALCALWRKFVPYAPTVAGLAVCGVLVGAQWTGTFVKVAEIGRLGGELWRTMKEAEGWLAAQPRGPLDRVLYQPGDICLDGNVTTERCDEVYHRHHFSSGPVRTGLPRLKFGYEATAIFKNLPVRERWPSDAYIIRRMVLEQDALKNLHVRWIFSITEWPARPDIRVAKRFPYQESSGKKGEIIIYEVDWGKQPPVRLEGPGKVELLQWSDELIRVMVSGAAKDSRLYYPVAYFYPWHAYANGAPLAIDLYGVLPRTTQNTLITVEAKDGEVVLRYKRPWYERTANWVSCGAWLATLAMAVSLVVVRRRRRTG